MTDCSNTIHEKILVCSGLINKTISRKLMGVSVHESIINKEAFGCQHHESTSAWAYVNKTFILAFQEAFGCINTMKAHLG